MLPTVRVALMDGRADEAGVLRVMLESAAEVERVEIVPPSVDVVEAFRSSGLNALAINIFSVNDPSGVSRIEQIRQAFPEAPVCLLGTTGELSELPGVPSSWRKRLGHYYRIATDLPMDQLARETRAASRRLADYLLYQQARLRLKDVRHLVASWQSSSSPIDVDTAKQIREAIEVAEEAIGEKERPDVSLGSVVPGYGEADVQKLIESTIERATRALNWSATANAVVLAVGITLVLGSFVAALVTKGWEPALFGGLGMAGVIASLVANPLRTIGLGARRLVQLQVAYLGFMNQVRLLGTRYAEDDTDACERSRQLNASTLGILKALEAHFGS